MSSQGANEILVILQEQARLPEPLVSAGRVLHSVSDRVAVFEPQPGTDISSLLTDRAIRWAGQQPPEDVLDELDPVERMFVDGWLVRMRGKGERPGEGLDWDAPGHLPPDRPRTRRGPSS